MDNINKVNVKLTLLNLYILIAKHNYSCEYKAQIKLPIINFMRECINVFKRFPYYFSPKINRANLFDAISMRIQERTFSAYLRILLDCELISKTDAQTRNVVYDFSKILIFKSASMDLPKHYESDEICKYIWEKLAPRSTNAQYPVLSLFESLSDQTAETPNNGGL